MAAIKKIELWLYHDRIYVGKIKTKYEGQTVIKSHKYGSFIIPGDSSRFFIHGRSYKLIYDVNSIYPMKPAYTKIDVKAIISGLKGIDYKKDKTKALKKVYEVLKKEAEAGSQLTDEFKDEFEKTVYLPENMIDMEMKNITPREFERLISGEDFRNLTKPDKPDYSWLFWPLMLFMILGVVIVMTFNLGL